MIDSNGQLTEASKVGRALEELLPTTCRGKCVRIGSVFGRLAISPTWSPVESYQPPCQQLLLVNSRWDADFERNRTIKPGKSS